MTEEKVVEELQLLKLQNLRLRVSAIDGKIEAIQQRSQALAIEMQVLPGKLEEAKAAREKQATEFQSAYTAAKEELEIPEGMDINLETGKIEEIPAQ